MPRSRSLSVRTGVSVVTVSGVAIVPRFRRSWTARGALLHLQLDRVVLDDHREGVEGNVGGQSLGLTAREVEQRAMSGAFHSAGVGVEGSLDERAFIVRAAILDRVHGPCAVEHADLEIVPLDQALTAWRELVQRTDVDQLGHVLDNT